MNTDMLSPHLQREVMEKYFMICRYFLVTRQYGYPGDLVRMDYYHSILQSEPLPKSDCSHLLDLQILSATHETQALLVDTYPPEFILHIILSGTQTFFDQMGRFASIDVSLRSTPTLFSFFNTTNSSIQRALEDAIIQRFSFCLPA